MLQDKPPSMHTTVYTNIGLYRKLLIWWVIHGRDDPLNIDVYADGMLAHEYGLRCYFWNIMS